MDYKFIKISGDDLILFNPNLKLFEKKMKQAYPLGTKFFTIDHGANYTAFFSRLGEVSFNIIQNNKDKTIVGTACAIKRSFDTGLQIIDFWYMCDLKIEEAHRGQNLTKSLFMHLYQSYNSISNKGYLISMDPGSNRIVHIFDSLSKIMNQPKTIIKLFIYMVKIDIMNSIENLFKIQFGDITYKSLAGVKDIIIDNKSHLKIYHLQHGPYGDYGDNGDNGCKFSDIETESYFMFCLPADSQIKRLIDIANIRTDITATIIAWNMDFFDWHNILTSDI